jgi:hypothetical protein
MNPKLIVFACLVLLGLATARGDEPYRPFGLQFGATKGEIEKSIALPKDFTISDFGHGPYYQISGLGEHFPDCPPGKLCLYFGRKLDRLWRVLWVIPDLIAADRETVTKKILTRLKGQGFTEISAKEEEGDYLLQKGDVMANLNRNPASTSGTNVAFYANELRNLWHRERLEHDRQWLLEKLNKSSCILYPGMSVRYKHFSLDQESGACYMITNRVILKTTGEELEEELSFNLRDTDFNFEEVTALDKGIIMLSFKEKTAFLKTRLSGVQDAGKMVTRIAVDICPLEDASYCVTTLGFLKEMLVNGTSLSY